MNLSKQVKLKIKVLKTIGGILTLCGIILLIKGDLTNGFLAMIIGELVDLPYRIRWYSLINFK